MEKKLHHLEINKAKASEFVAFDELANLKRLSEINNFVSFEFGDLVISSANETHIKELGELWANLACIQQIFAPNRYIFKGENKNWEEFVTKKLDKQCNLLLVACEKGSKEVKGFLYFQTITIPSSDLVIKGIIDEIYTKPQHRKKGIAAKLLDVSLEWAQSYNIRQVDLVSITKSRDLLEFYLKYMKRSNSEVKLELVTI